MRIGSALASLLLLAGCSGIATDAAPPSSDLPAAPVAPTAYLLGAVLVASQATSVSIGRLSEAETGADLDAFVLSCPVATTRPDLSGLTQPQDWQGPCAAAENWPRAQASQFFATQFTPVQVGDGSAFATGYFEPQIAGGRTRQSPTDVPVYAVPNDLERCWREDIAPSERIGRAPLSRRLPDGTCTRYFTRAEIEQGALQGRAAVCLLYTSPSPRDS